MTLKTTYSSYIHLYSYVNAPTGIMVNNDQQLFLVPELHIIFFSSGAEIYSDFFALF